MNGWHCQHSTGYACLKPDEDCANEVDHVPAGVLWVYDERAN